MITNMKLAGESSNPVNDNPSRSDGSTGAGKAPLSHCIESCLLNKGYL